MKTGLGIFKFLFKILFRFLRGPVIISVLSEMILQVSIGLAVFRGKKILNIILVRPSKYDDETGFVMRDFRGVLPSNTLTTIYSLVKNVEDNLRLGTNIKMVLRVYDDAVQKVQPDRIADLCRLFPSKSLAMLVGVQTNQFVRATDLALDFQKRGIQAIVGGFHVSGSLVQFPQDGQEINKRAFQKLGLEKLTSNNVSIFAGEAEGRILSLLQDFLAGKLKLVYNYLHNPPNLIEEPTPLQIPKISQYFISQDVGTVDACRGCFYNCSFCTVRNVHGKVIRARGVQSFKDAIRRNWKLGIRSYVFTSDNASRDPLWKERFEALIEMRVNEGIIINFFMQVDVLCYKIPGFIELASKAGCKHAFIGIESMNPLNLKQVKKRQNKPDDYYKLNAALRENNIIVHYAYMIGLMYDTPQSISQDVDSLMELGPDIVTFYIVNPLPGSDDHFQMFTSNEWMHPDFNAYDTFADTVSRHPRMSRAEWLESYHKAWQTIYSQENLARVLKRSKKELYWRNFWMIIWYKYALDVSQRHPMISGFIRQWERQSRRNTFPKMTWLEFQQFSFRERMKIRKRTVKLIFDLTEVWLQTRKKSAVEQKVAALVASMHPSERSFTRLKEIKGAYHSLGKKLPSQVKLVIQRSTRADIDEHWIYIRRQLTRGKFWVLFSSRSIHAFIMDLILVTSFLRTFFQFLRRD